MSSAAKRGLAFVEALALRALGATWRLRSSGHNPLDHDPGAQIGAIWHQDMIIAAYVYRDRGFSVAVSRSRDGEHLSAALGKLGYREPLRGSSSRGGAAALRGLVRAVSAGTTVSVQMDGPRGPACRAKLGVGSLARLSGAPITPVAFAASPCLRLRSWDRTRVPLPFARVELRYGEPIAVPSDASEEQEESLRLALEESANTLCEELEAEF